MKKHILYRPKSERTPEEEAFIRREAIKVAVAAFIVVILAIIFLAIIINILQALGGVNGA